MRLITYDDIFETYLKIYQRGYKYIFSKLSLSQKQRTKSTFNTLGIESANYWIIPRVRQRWNLLITGEKDTSYESYIVGKYFAKREDLTLLSLGSGVCSHEIKFAKHNCFKTVKCVDFSEKILEKAKQNAAEQGVANMIFESADVNTFQISESSYDIILFHSSLHHFKNIPKLLTKVRAGLKSNGVLVINEYIGPNRLQIKRNQIESINQILRFEIPKDYRKRFITNTYKNRISGSGILRMIITDPSEAVESSRIVPSIRDKFDILEEKELGGDFLMWLFKDISHNFMENSSQTNAILDRVFKLEDDYLKRNVSNFILGVYKAKTNY